MRGSFFSFGAAAGTLMFVDRAESAAIIFFGFLGLGATLTTIEWAVKFKQTANELVEPGGDAE